MIMYISYANVFSAVYLVCAHLKSKTLNFTFVAYLTIINHAWQFLNFKQFLLDPNWFRQWICLQIWSSGADFLGFTPAFVFRMARIYSKNWPQIVRVYCKSLASGAYYGTSYGIFRVPSYGIVLYCIRYPNLWTLFVLATPLSRF